MQGKTKRKRARKKSCMSMKPLKSVLGFVLYLVLVGFVSIKLGSVAGNLITCAKNKMFEMSHPLLYMAEEDVIADNQEVIERMRSGWQESKDVRRDKIEAAKLIVQIEALNLKLPYAPDVEFGTVAPLSGGHFNQKSRKIVIRADKLHTCSVEELIIMICHEMKHAEQYEVIKAFHKTDKKYKNLAMYDEARVLTEEFTYYIDPTISVQGYKSQYCEQEAKRYSEERLSYYTNVILARR